MELKPIRSLPPRRDRITDEVSAMDARPRRSSVNDSIVVPKARDRLMELIEREQFPEDVRQTLAGALTGDLTRQALLFQAMVDTWPRLSKSLGEVRRQMSLTPWIIEPYKKKGDDEATPSAKERADFVENAFLGMKGRPAYNDSDSETLIEDLAMGYFFGHHVSEVSWKRGEGGIVPQYAKSLSARFYGYLQSEEGEDRLMLRKDGNITFDGYEDFPPHKFLLGVNTAHPGHPSVAAPLRALAQYWLASTFGLKWMFQFTQNFGVPFRWATYSDEGDEAKVCQMLDQIGSAGYAAFKAGTKLEFVEASKGGAGSLPQETLLSMADKQCDIFILGQSLTSDVGDSGSRALGDVHNEVRLDVMQGIANHVAKVINCQFFPSIVSLNYGDDEETPKISATFAPSKDEQKRVERDRILFKEMGLPVSKDYLYERHEVPIPKEGDLLFLAETGGSEGEPVAAMRADKTETVEQLSANVLEGLTGVSKEWLSGVRPTFDKLAALAESGNVSDDDFLTALTSAQEQLPELFGDLDTEALEKAFVEAIGSGMLSGSVERFEGEMG